MNNINQRRKALGLTQQQLADMMKVTSRTVQNWERGLPIPSNMKSYLEKELGVTFDDDGDAAVGLIVDGDNNRIECGNGNFVASHKSSALDKALNEIAELRKALCEERRINQENTSRFLGIIETMRGVSNAE